MNEQKWRVERLVSGEYGQAEIKAGEEVKRVEYDPLRTTFHILVGPIGARVAEGVNVANAD